MEVPSPAMYEERLRLMRAAFEDALIALLELDQDETVARLRERWPEAQGAETAE